MAGESRLLSLGQEQQKGLEYISENVKHGGLAVGVGPPGTGKTAIFNKAYADTIEDVERDEVVIHVAPTNRLVEEAAVRTMTLLLLKGYDVENLRSSIRVYGSRFEPRPLDENTKLVFTTGYQPGALLRLSRFKRRIHLMVDEASTTALHEAFVSLSLSLANEIRRKNLEFIGSFNVIGDPMQAIVESAGTSWKYEQLIVYRMILSILPEDERKEVRRNPPRMFEIAERYASGSGIKYFFLDRTYRMPEPTELIVSIPFYEGRLRAARRYTDALKGILLEGSQAQSLLRETACLSKFKEVKEALDNALESQVPIVYIKDKGPAYSGIRSFRGLDEYDVLRSTLASEVAAYAALRTNVSRVMVVAPYNEVVQQARAHALGRFARHLGERKRSLSFATVHSVLGSEADIVVAVIGKEHIGKRHETIYFQTPELVNVQTSRHSRMLIIIGNVERLAKNMVKKGEGYEHVSRIAEAVEELKSGGFINLVCLSA